MRALTTCILVLSCLCLHSQVTVINDYGGKRQVADPTQYKLAGTTEHTVIVKHFTLIDDGQRHNLIGLIVSAIDFYLDEVMEISEDRMIVRKSDKEIMRDLQEIVDENIKRYDYQVDESFRGFSEELQNKIKTIEQLNWSARPDDIENNTSFDKRQMALNYVRKQINEFKEITARDLDIYARLHVHEFKDSLRSDEPEFASLSAQDSFKLNDPLTPYNFELYKQELEDIGMYIKPAVSDLDIPTGTNKEIMALLKSNNDLIKMFGEQMIRLQSEMVDLKKESNAHQKEFLDFRKELNGLQLAINEINENNQAALEHSNPIISTRSMTVVHFRKNSADISISERALLNSVVYELTNDKDKSAMITGFADQSGTPEMNARISKVRADMVKNYLINKGISSKRLLVNYLGDSRSTSENSDDRKVEVALIVK